jgi:hypothetical protein
MLLLIPPTIVVDTMSQSYSYNERNGAYMTDLEDEEMDWRLDTGYIWNRMC